LASSSVGFPFTLPSLVRLRIISTFAAVRLAVLVPARAAPIVLRSVLMVRLFYIKVATFQVIFRLFSQIATKAQQASAGDHSGEVH